MIVKCSNCDASYTVEDQKVKDKKFAFECPKCQTNVVIDNRAVQGESGLKLDIEQDNELDSEISGDSFNSEQDDFSNDLDLGEDSDEFAEMEDEIEPEIDLSVLTPDASVPDQDSDLSTGEGDLSMDFEDFSEEAIDLPDDVEKSENESINLSDFGSDFDEEDTLTDLSNEKSIVNLGGLADSPDEDSIDLGGLPTSSDEDSVDFDGLPELEAGDSINFDELAEEEVVVGPFDEDGLSEEPDEAVIDESENLTLDDFEDIDSVDGENLSLDEKIKIPGEIIDDEPNLSLDDFDEIELSSAGEIEDDSDENITLDLDSLDIDLEEEPTIVEGEKSEEISLDELDMNFDDSFGKEGASLENFDNNETLDLDSLDIALEEEEEIKQSEQLEDEGRLSLEDAGLTMDEIVESDEADSNLLEESDEEDLHLSIGELAPDFDMEEVAGDENLDSKEEKLIVNDFEDKDLPEVDFNSLENSDEDFLDIENSGEFQKYTDDLDSFGDETRRVSSKGFVNFSIDYTLKFSRIKALLRLLGVYFILFIPHFFVFLVYSILSFILGAINWFLVLFTGSSERDFVEIQEQVLRYYLAILANAMDVVEELPVYSGKKDIDHSLQLSISHPTEYSRFFAFMRITGVGMFLILLPHLILIFVLSLGVNIFYLIGLFSIIFTGKWPSIIFDFMIRYLRYLANIKAFAVGLIDTYPSFKFD